MSNSKCKFSIDKSMQFPTFFGTARSCKRSAFDELFQSFFSLRVYLLSEVTANSISSHQWFCDSALDRMRFYLISTWPKIDSQRTNTSAPKCKQQLITPSPFDSHNQLQLVSPILSVWVCASNVKKAHKKFMSDFLWLLSLGFVIVQFIHFFFFLLFHCTATLLLKTS